MKNKGEATESKVAEQATPEQPRLTVSLSLQEWEAVLAVIENSTSAHIQVKAVASELVKQLQPQVKNG